jgi:hypothetical protein
MKPDRDRCAAVRDRLLDADPGALRGEGDDPVALHLRECAACRATAKRLLAATATLDASLTRLSSDASSGATRIPEVHDADRTSTAWFSPPPELGQGPGERAPRRASPAPPSTHCRRWPDRRWAALPLTALAAAVIVLVGRPADDPTADADADALRSRAERLLSPSSPGAEAEDGVAVIRTADPDVTLVWLLR